MTLPAALPTAGHVFAGRYRLQNQIGSGGFGAVYEAIHVVTERRVAIKLLWPHFAKDAEFRKRFLREARLATQIGSEFIVDVLDAGVEESSDTPFLVMELLKGESISARVSRKKRLSAEDTSIYLSQVAAALDRTHAKGVVHRDLKPANLFLTQRTDGSPLVKILDFGIAKLLASTAMEQASLTLGTPLFMAPEQFTNSALTPAVDIYALGMIAFRFLAGAHYYQLEQSECDNVYLLAATIGRGPSEAAIPRARRYGAELPVRFDPWFARACNKEPSERFATASDALFALADAIGVAVSAPLVARPSRLRGALTNGIDSLPDHIRRSVSAARPAGIPFGGTVPLVAPGDKPERVTALAPTAPAPASSRRPIDVVPTIADDEAPTAGSAVAHTVLERVNTAPVLHHTVASQTVTDPGALGPSRSSEPALPEHVTSPSFVTAPIARPGRALGVAAAALVAAFVLCAGTLAAVWVAYPKKDVSPSSAASLESQPEPSTSASVTAATTSTATPPTPAAASASAPSPVVAPGAKPTGEKPTAAVAPSPKAAASSSKPQKTPETATAPTKPTPATPTPAGSVEIYTRE